MSKKISPEKKQRRKKAAVITALSCVAAGLVMAAAALASVKFDFSKLNTIELQPKSYEVQASFQNIRVNAAHSDIRILPSEDNTCKVVCTEGENLTHAVFVEDDTLVIAALDDRKWYERIGISWGTMYIDVYLPKKDLNFLYQNYGSLYLKNTSGDISVSDNLYFFDSELYSTSGNINFSGISQNWLTAQTASGNIVIDDFVTGNLKLSSTSGDINLTSIKVQSIDAETSSGNINGQYVTASSKSSITNNSGTITMEDGASRELSAYCSSGDIDFSSLITDENLFLETHSGNITLTGDAKNLQIHAFDGNIDATLRTEKLFSAHTVSGHVDIPESSSNAQGKCEAITTSGNIKIIVAP